MIDLNLLMLKYDPGKLAPIASAWPTPRCAKQPLAHRHGQQRDADHQRPQAELEAAAG